MRIDRSLVGLFAGIVFGAGLTISRMVDPKKVLDFLDVTGSWDPSLAFVMGGAVVVAAVSFRRILVLPAPLLGGAFHLPVGRHVDARLMGGAALFGVGWGLAGFCPGPAIASLAFGLPSSMLFVAAMVAGMALWEWRPS